MKHAVKNLPAPLYRPWVFTCAVLLAALIAA
jgi:hypothetical protein